MSLWTRMAGRVRARRDDDPDPAHPSADRLTASSDASTTPDSSTALMRRLRQGDASALEPLYRTESPGVYRYALAVCGQPDWAADAMQEAFVQLATRPDGWDAGRGSLGAYLAGIARHHLLARWRDRPQAHDDDEDADSAADRSPSMESPEQQLVRAQDQAQLWAALHTLPWSFREAVVLVDLQERPYAEAARIAGVELNTLRTRLHRGRARLVVALSPVEGVAARLPTDDAAPGAHAAAAVSASSASRSSR